MQSPLPQAAWFTQARGPLMLTIQGGGKQQPGLALSWHTRGRSQMPPTPILTLHFALRTPCSMFWCSLVPSVAHQFLNLSHAILCAMARGEPQGMRIWTWPNL